MPELVGLARTMRSLAAPVATSRDRPRRHGGHRRRSLDLQRLDHGGAGRGGGRLRGRQARQPLLHQPLRLRRPARGARRQHRARARAGRALHRRGRLRLHVRPPPPHGDGARRAGAQGARRAHDLQLPRSADQPGRGASASCSASPTATTRRRSPRRWSGSAACGRWSSPPRTGVDEISISARTRVIEVDDGAHRGAVRRAGRLRLRRSRAGVRRRRHSGGERRRLPRRARRRGRPPAPPGPAQRRRRDLRRRQGREPRRGGREGGCGDRFGRRARAARAPRCNDQRAPAV